MYSWILRSSIMTTETSQELTLAGPPGDLDDEKKRWLIVGQHFLHGTPLGLEMVGDIRQQTQVLSRHVQTLCTATDIQFIRMQKEFKSTVETDLQDKIKNLESVCQHFLHGTPLGLEMVGISVNRHKFLVDMYRLCVLQQTFSLSECKEFKSTVETDLQDKIKNLESVCQHFLNGTPLGLEMVGTFVNRHKFLVDMYRLCVLQQTFSLSECKKNLKQQSTFSFHGTPLGLEMVGDIPSQQTQVLSRHVQTFVYCKQTFSLSECKKNLKQQSTFPSWNTTWIRDGGGTFVNRHKFLVDMYRLCVLQDIQFIRMQKEFKTTVETDLQDKNKEFRKSTFLHGTPLGLEMVGDIRQQTQVLSRHVQTLCTATDIQFIRMQKNLKQQ
ncbi:unnamed protein product [Mytilus edulis]|uniref:Uncharacterized protein n=1 Tax=Mytilus edulis TaxID=6550 RepID=A0A8S3QHR5_MYTED|nr:unnamed protein product [Mytilus edulis]